MPDGPQPAIGDYAMIGDCGAAALVDRSGSIDWCCVPRFDSASCFGRMLDWEGGGCCAFEPEEEVEESYSEYLESTLVLVTTVRTGGGEARVLDCFVMPPSDDRGDDCRRLVRIVEGRRGRFGFSIRVAPRFDYGVVEPWVRAHEHGLFSAIGGDDGLVIWSDGGVEAFKDSGELRVSGSVRPGERVRLGITYVRPEKIDAGAFEPPHAGGLDDQLERTAAWWRDWSSQVRLASADAPGALRSAIVLKALVYAPTGAMIAAPTTSLPESPGGPRNWDYRFSWIRDSALSVRSLARLGYERESDGFRRFIERSAAGRAEDLQILYGVGGERRMAEQDLSHLDGYRGARPVRAGNDAVGQTQLDAFGYLLDLSWRWHRRGNVPDDDYWRFLVRLVESVVGRWRDPDAGIWEWRGEPKQFVHSKVMCWTAVDRALALAEDCGRDAPRERWGAAREEIRAAVERDGYDRERGIFVQAFGEPGLDAALLRLPTVGFLDYRDERMVRTADAVRSELGSEGLLRRYSADDGLEGEEGAFLACGFWLAEVLARQGRGEQARAVFDRSASAANELGLFSEEYEPGEGRMLGNFPQALTHLSHIEAAIALAEAGR